MPTTLTTAAMMVVVEPPEVVLPFVVSKGTVDEEVLAEGRGVGPDVGDKYTTATSPACAPEYPKLIFSKELNDFEATAAFSKLVTAVVLPLGTIMT
jgi:hypothetical protein